ncbi:hypothetical protein [Flexivirga alba]|uniref:Uncharacterized protein n=1 Tax=Flexivirga alba TaxID=702742 RepID=A0ABW2AJF1_9MICO
MAPEPMWDLDRVRALLEEPVLRIGADHEIVTTGPTPVVVSEVEKLIAAVR